MQLAKSSKLKPREDDFVQSSCSEPIVSWLGACLVLAWIGCPACISSSHASNHEMHTKAVASVK
eukprot:1001755-Amphidinium_carterae.1